MIEFSIIMDDAELIEMTRSAMKMAYVPYSKFKVGSTLVSINQEYISGCNIENISFTPTVCAERVAIFSAISQGITKFEKIYVFTDDENLSSPCGVCLQVLSEFVDGDFIIILANNIGKIIKRKFSEFFPFPFVPKTKIGTQ